MYPNFMVSFPYLFAIQRGLSSAIGHRLRSSAAPGGWTSARPRRGAPGGGGQVPVTGGEAGSPTWKSMVY